jgi:demethylmenaquinone methyltransferase/2-methoxy-6-polyprenyl-1,4-benzoquinol methylase
LVGGLGRDWRRVVEGIEEIGPKYPWLNRVISLGLDRFVRRLAVLSAGNPVGRILDAGAGDGSLTVVIQSLARGSRHFLVMLDPSERMLRLSQRRVNSENTDRVAGLLEHPPFAPRTIDRTYMAFSLRDVYDLEEAVRSLASVMRDEGLLTVVDIAKPDDAAAAAIHHLYWRFVSPFLAALAFTRYWRQTRLIYTTYRLLPSESSLLSLLRRHFTPIITRRLLLGGLHILVMKRQLQGSTRRPRGGCEGGGCPTNTCRNRPQLRKSQSGKD